MDKEEQESLQYRFSGYQLPTIQLDETGPAYYVVHPHPYFYNQPVYWQKAAYLGNQLPATSTIEGDVAIEQTGNVDPPGIVRGVTYSTLPPMLPLT